MPNKGVSFITAAGLSPVHGVSTANCGMVGVFERGPMDEATLVTSWQQFTTIFGTKPAPGGESSFYSVKAFFLKVGTGILWVVRVASSSAAKSTHTFVDRQGSPASTLKVDAVDEGLWGDGLSVDVDDDNILSTTLTADANSTDTSAALTSVGGLEPGSYVEFDNGTNQEVVTVISIDYPNKTINWTGGLTNTYTTANGIIKSQEFKLLVSYLGVLAETWPGLSMNDSVSFHVEKVVVGSVILCTDLKGSDTDYEDQPVATAATALTAGDDGLTGILGSDFSGSSATSTGFFAFNAVDAPFFRFAAPDPMRTDADPAVALLALNQAGIDYAETRGKCHYYYSAADNTSPTNAITWDASFVSEKAHSFYPWAKVQENGKALYLPPDMFAMGTTVEKDFRRGVHKAAGNETIAYAIDLRIHVSVGEDELLDAAGINTIRRVAGLRVYGDRSKSATADLGTMSASEYHSFLQASLEAASQWAVFEINDLVLWKAIERQYTEFLSREQAKRALFDPDDPTAPAYEVVMNSTNNPSGQTANGIAAVSVKYRKSDSARSLVITMTPAPLGLAAAA